jgi:putative transposase
VLEAHERAMVKSEVLFWHRKKWRTHALTVMPDHVHLLATPLQARKNRWYSLAEILHSVKRRSSRSINASRGRSGGLWQSESGFDRIVRDEKEFQEKLDYILNNAVVRGLVTDPWQYDGFWCESMESQLELPAIPLDTPDEGHVWPRLQVDRFVVYRRYLPHWQMGGSTYFVTFRLAARWL